MWTGRSDDIWTFIKPPLAVYSSFVFGHVPGMLDTSREGNLTISWTIPPWENVIDFEQCLPGKTPDDPLIFRKYRFAVDHEKRTLRFLDATTAR